MSYPVLLSCWWTLRSDEPTYAERARELKEWCETAGLKHDITDQTRRALAHAANVRQHNPIISWRNAAFRYLPTFLEAKLLDLQRPILFASADCRLIERPPADCFPEPVEVAWLARPTAYYTVPAAPLYFAWTPLAFAFLGTWKTLCADLRTNQSEHLPLELTVRLYRDVPGCRPFPDTIERCHELTERGWT